jgi:hypothetical protein
MTAKLFSIYTGMNKLGTECFISHCGLHKIGLMWYNCVVLIQLGLGINRYCGGDEMH